MGCFECGGPSDLFFEVEGNLRFLCRGCYYRPDECLYNEMATDWDSALTICTRCRTVWDQDEEIEGFADEFNGRWYVTRKVDLPYSRPEPA